MVMENAILIFVSLCCITIAAFLIECLGRWVNHQRHVLRKKLRQRYVVKQPKRFFHWSETLSLIEIKRHLRLLDGRHILEELEGVLLPR